MFFQHSGLWLPAVTKSKLWRPTKQSPIHVIDGFVWNPWREEFQDVRGASYHEIVASLGINQLIGFGSSAATSFTPITNTYNSGTSVTETSPSGATSCTVTSDGGGGGGSKGTTTFTCRGGGGSGRCVSGPFAITGGTDALTYTVGAAGVGKTGTSGSGTAGGNTTTTGGTGGFTGLAHSAGGGGGATTAANGTGGTASGGTTNTAGSNGTSTYLTDPGGGNAASGAAGGANGDDVSSPAVAGAAPGAGGGGGTTAGFNPDGANGGAGRISFAYT